MEPAVIVSVARTPVGKAPRGRLAAERPDDLGAHVLAAALERAPGLAPDTVDDVVLGCAFPEAEQGLNVARSAALLAGLPDSVPAMTVNRFCASSLAALGLAADRIATGGASAILTGGVESMSRVPMTGHTFRPNPRLAATAPELYLGMGLTAERVAQRFDVNRADQDAFALHSHQKALAAVDAGHFVGEIAPLDLPAGRPGEKASDGAGERFAVDEGPRRDSDAEGLARLRPAFAKEGTVTAGNASQMSDGAAAVLVTSAARARDVGLPPLARVRSWSVVGVPPEIMGIGPVEAIPRALEQAGVAASDVDLFEINEAFAAQVLYCLRALDLDAERVNVNGGAIALGHPLGATGARLVATLVSEMVRRDVSLGVVSLCVGGGMGMAMVLERA